MMHQETSHQEKSHQENSFEAAALPFLDSLYRTAFRMAHDQGIAERSVEQTYVEARNSFHHLPEVTGHRVWLFAILFRTLHNRRKAWLHIKGWLNRSPETQYELADADASYDAADQDEMLGALDRIPGILREVLLLADVEGFDKTEIQEILGIPGDVVFSRLAEGRTRLHAGLTGGGRMNPPLAENPAVA
jgi:RNA polymerase sigma-70 factor (ECF subfamily)